MAETDYDRVPYRSNSYPQTHPNHLAVLARMMGMNPESIVRARVLELGCGAGGNLLPLAAMLPEAQFVGIDLAPTSIETAQAVIDELGLKNISVYAMSITDVPEDFGLFDFIICHGVYSWVPDVVRAAILAVSKRHLAPQGVGFLSYNALPGWGMRGLVRDMLMYHARDFENMEEKTSQARGLLKFLSENTLAGPDYKLLLEVEHKRIADHGDWYIYHDNLAPVNQPFWLHEVVAAFRASGLQYISDASFSSMLTDALPANVQEVLAGLEGDMVRTEQYLDFLRCRMFRQSLFTHREVAMDRRIGGGRLRGFAFSTRAKPTVEPIDLSEGVTIEFKTSTGLELTTASPLLKATMAVLYDARPALIPFDRLLTAARLRLNIPLSDTTDLEEQADFLAQNLVVCFANEVVVPHEWLAPFATRVAERPHVWEYARYQARAGNHMLTNQRHETVPVMEFDRRLAILCDGTRDRHGLIESMLEAVDAGVLKIFDAEEREFTTRQELVDNLATAVDVAVMSFVRMALLKA